MHLQTITRVSTRQTAESIPYSIFYAENLPEADLDLEPGLYVLNLFVSWQNFGDASYGFLVQVV